MGASKNLIFREMKHLKGMPFPYAQRVFDNNPSRLHEVFRGPLDFDGGAGGFEFFLHLVRFFLGHGVLDRRRRGSDQVFGHVCIHTWHYDCDPFCDDGPIAVHRFASTNRDRCPMFSVTTTAPTDSA